MSNTTISILSIEDDAAVRLSIVGYLRDRGFKLFEAENGREGLDIFRRENPDLILVDLRIPEIDGLEVLKTISEESPDTPIIVVSGTGIIANAIEALHLGAWDYVLKPIEDMAILLHAVHKSLERARLIVRNRQYQEHLEELVKKRTVELEEANKALKNYQEHLEDLVEKRTLELEQSHQQLRQSERLASIGTLAAGIAHEINNPLGMMLLDVDDALSSDVDEELHTNLIQIKNNIERCSGIVKSVLQFARDIPSDRSSLELNDLIGLIVGLLRSSAGSRSIELDTDLCASDLNVVGNKVQLQQVFVNLIDNAFNSCAGGGTVRIATSQINQTVRAVISDTGAGMTEEQCRRIFEPFFTTRLHQGGTGLGMSIAHGIISEHDGTIVVDSELGKGTKITIDLPTAT